MLPDTREWRSWNALEKATYIAQVLAPISLLVTAFFAFLSWREAAAALAVQQKTFYAQNAPYLEVMSVEVPSEKKARNRPGLWVKIKNAGNSDATEACIALQPKGKTINDICNESDNWYNIDLMPNHNSLIIFDDYNLKRMGSRYGASEAYILDAEEWYDCKEGKTPNTEILGLAFKDVLGNLRYNSQTLLLCY